MQGVKECGSVRVAVEDRGQLETLQCRDGERSAMVRFQGGEGLKRADCAKRAMSAWMAHGR